MVHTALDLILESVLCFIIFLELLFVLCSISQHLCNCYLHPDSVEGERRPTLIIINR